MIVFLKAFQVISGQIILDTLGESLNLVRVGFEDSATLGPSGYYNG